jgi:hypothetical protein
MMVLRNLAVLFLFTPVILFFAPHLANAKKAETIEELVEMYDSSSCRDCHAEIYEEWQKSLHARSIFGPEGVGRTAATFKTTIEVGLMHMPHSGVTSPKDVKVEHLMICAKCHLPQLENAEDSVAQEIVEMVYEFVDYGDEDAAKILQSLNIGCTICHNRNAIIHKWTDGPPEPGVIYGKIDGAHESETHPVLKAGPVIHESILCGQCHGLGPSFELDNPVQCATLYGAHLYTYIPEGGTHTCQECHMQRSGLGHNIQSYRSPEMAQMALDIEVHARAYQWRDITTMLPEAHVLVELTNKAGHPIPDG